jgi:hypothetical protein
MICEASGVRRARVTIPANSRRSPTRDPVSGRMAPSDTNSETTSITITGLDFHRR